MIFVLNLQYYLVILLKKKQYPKDLENYWILVASSKLFMKTRTAVIS